MGYYLRAFVGKKEDLKPIVEAYNEAKIIPLAQGISLVPHTEALYDQINNFESSANIGSFEFLTVNIENKILKIIDAKAIAYVEADYFGGEGGQVGIIWTGGKRIAEFKYGQDVINAVSKHFGVRADKGKDEFATLGFGRHRNTADWLD
jgi:hypothetical protein